MHSDLIFSTFNLAPPCELCATGQFGRDLMPKAVINGVQIYYEVHGEGFPLILSWGVGGSTRLWQMQVPALSKKYRLILWDPRGHGQSESPQDPAKYSIPISASDLLGLMDHLELP